MIDLTDSFFEGVKISPENNICWESFPKNNGCWIKGLLIISCFGVDLPKREMCISVVSQNMVVYQCMAEPSKFGAIRNSW